MKTLTELMNRNRAWAARIKSLDPKFFDRLSEIQKPDFLWIGCADSRVPANEIVGMAPGELFVHRNVANVVVSGDPNCMAVVQYAIETLGVKHIIVCGHYGCGGVRAVLENNFGGQAHVERWLRPLCDIASKHAGELASDSSLEARWDKLCEINVREQVERLMESDVIVRARMRGDIFVYGLIYSLRDGLLRELVAHRPAPAMA